MSKLAYVVRADRRCWVTQPAADILCTIWGNQPSVIPAPGDPLFLRVEQVIEQLILHECGDKGASDVFKSIRYNTPFANLFYTEAVVNYGLLYGTMESLSPGYLARIEAQAQGRGSPFIFEPSNLYGGI